MFAVFYETTAERRAGQGQKESCKTPRQPRTTIHRSTPFRHRTAMEAVGISAVNTPNCIAGIGLRFFGTFGQ